ncbi:MAG TPA: HepT-like ribonuclease domain-containing protein, partial [Rhodocyclaceae bacterium]|nr:HepT-like ribonuclease domain-containing protein [Rhodocyclaceae bacterium]
ANKIIQLDPAIEQSAPRLWQQFRDAYDMRSVLTHEYFRVDAAIVWTTVKTNLPILETQLLEFAAAFKQDPSTPH